MTIKQNAQDALDELRRAVVAFGQEFRSGKKADDVSVDLLSVGTNIRVVMTDSRTLARVKAGQARMPIGITFQWGSGIAGRALRLMGALGWSRQEHKGHATTWPARDFYQPVKDIGPHAHIACWPLTTTEDGQVYAFGMLSFVTNKHDSVLGEIVRRLRTPADVTVVQSRCETLIAQFTSSLGRELEALVDDEGTGGTHGNGN